MGGIRARRAWRVGLRLALVAATALAIFAALAVPLPHSVRMTRIVGVVNLGHFFGFAALAACLAWAWPGARGAAAVLAMGIAGVGEAVQPWFGRIGDWRDFAFGTLGALAGWVLVRGAARPGGTGVTPVAPSPRSRARVAGHGLAVLALAVWPMVCCMPDVLDTWTEWRAFPVLYDFQTPWQARRWLKSNVAIERVADAEGGWAGRFELTPRRDGSAMAVLFPLHSDWNGYRRLVWEILRPLFGRKIHVE